MKELQQNVTVRGIIAILVILGGGLLLYYGDLSERSEGHIEAMMMLVLGFYFVDAQNSAKKDQTIENMTTYKKGGNE